MDIGVPVAVSYSPKHIPDKEPTSTSYIATWQILIVAHAGNFMFVQGGRNRRNLCNSTWFRLERIEGGRTSRVVGLPGPFLHTHTHIRAHISDKRSPAVDSRSPARHGVDFVVRT